MMEFRRLSFAILLLILAPAAQGAGVRTIAAQLDQLNQALQGRTFDANCWVDPNSSGQSCNEITDNFCRNFWDKHEGNMPVFDGVLRAGDSEKSSLSLARIDDYKALADSLPRLPKDLRSAASPVLRD